MVSALTRKIDAIEDTKILEICLRAAGKPMQNENAKRNVYASFTVADL